MRSALLTSLTLFLPLLLSCGGGGTDGTGPPVAASFGDLAATVRKPLEASNEAIARASMALAKSGAKTNPELLASLSAAQTAVKDVIRQQESVVTQLEVLAKVGQQLQADKASLEKDKADLEKRERLFSTGFYAALITALVAIATVIGKFPMQRLEMQLKRLEIEEKQIEIAKKQSEAAH